MKKNGSQWIRKRKKLNSRGMTLIEVITAMAILALVIAPTLKMFANASGTNLRSRKATRAFTVGESTMEAAKAYSVQQLCSQFLAGNFKGVNTSTNPAHPTTMDAKGITATGTKVDPLLADRTLKEDVVSYTMTASNIESEGNFYDLVMDVTPVVKPDAFEIEDRNAYTDAIISLKEDMSYDAVNKLKLLAESTFEANFSSYHTASSHSIDDIEITKLVRTIDVDVTDGGSSQSVVVKVTYTCTAKVSYHYSNSAAPGGASTSLSDTKTYDDTIMIHEVVFAGDPDPSTPEYTVYENSGTVGGVSVNGRPSKLSKVYLYYFPNYSSVFGTGAEDIINVTADLSASGYNPGSKTKEEAEAEGCQPLKFTLAKQMSTTMSDFDLNSGEVLYDATVDATLSGGGQMDLWHNLGENLSPLGSVISTPSISGFSSVASVKDGSVDRVNMLYDVNIKVFEAGADQTTAEPLATYAGTINN